MENVIFRRIVVNHKFVEITISISKYTGLIVIDSILGKMKYQMFSLRDCIKAYKQHFNK